MFIFKSMDGSYAETVDSGFRLLISRQNKMPFSRSIMPADFALILTNSDVKENDTGEGLIEHRNRS